MTSFRATFLATTTRKLSVLLAVGMFLTTTTTTTTTVFASQEEPEGLMIAGYKPDYQVTDHNAIDLDQQLLQSLLAADNLTAASLVYQKGAHSKSYAYVTLQVSTGKINKNTAFVGTTHEGNPIMLYAYSNYDAGETSIKLRYDTTAGSICHVGANPQPVVGGCLIANGTIALAGIHQATPLPYEYNPFSGNKNGRTLAGFSTAAEKKMGKCTHCPYKDYDKYLAYYNGHYDYAHQWVMAALERRSTPPGFFSLGNGAKVDFAEFSSSALAKAIEVMTLNLNVWMYVVREFEDALDDCNKECALDQCNADKVNAWDEGIAFYTGSLEGRDIGGSGDGVLAYGLSDELCVDFKTCGPEGSDTEGLSYVNRQVFDLSTPALELLKAEQCNETRIYVEEIVKLMTVPLVQGLLRATYYRNDDDSYKGEVTAYAASVLPLVHNCSAEDAMFLQEQLLFASNSNADADYYKTIKRTLERHYDCMGITCQQVGGLWDHGTNNRYLMGAAPCTFSSGGSGDDGNDNNGNMALIMGLFLSGILMLLLALGGLILRNDKKRKQKQQQQQQRQEQPLKR